MLGGGVRAHRADALPSQCVFGAAPRADFGFCRPRSPPAFEVSLELTRGEPGFSTAMAAMVATAMVATLTCLIRTACRSWVG